MTADRMNIVTQALQRSSTAAFRSPVTDFVYTCKLFAAQIPDSSTIPAYPSPQTGHMDHLIL